MARETVGDKSFFTLRVVFWTCAVFFGAVETWYMRHRTFSDAISYLAIAQAYLRGDWHGALNSYWSPLYSWLLAIYLALFRPGVYWHTSALHVVNYLAFLVACGTFEQFALALVRAKSDLNWRIGAISRETILVMAYLSILYDGLWRINIGYASPDMIAYAVIGFLAWMLFKLESGPVGARHSVAFGLALGVGFLDRSAFSGFIPFYLAAAVGILWRKGRPMRVPFVLMVASLLFIGAPFVVAISINRGYFTLGDAGRLNYGWEVNGAARWSHWQGEPFNIGRPQHAERLILTDPVPVFEFRSPVGGPYPPWYDPSYWYAGIRPHFSLKQQLPVLTRNLVRVAVIGLSSPAIFLIVLLVLTQSDRLRSLRSAVSSHYLTALPAVAGLFIYCLVYVEKRYIAGFVTVILLLLLTGLVGPVKHLRRLIEPAARLICLLVFLIMIVYRPLLDPLMATAADLAHGHERNLNFNAMLAEKFTQLGLHAGDSVAFVGLAKDADWIRILGCKTVAEVPIIFEEPVGILGGYEFNFRYLKAFVNSDEAAREKVYDAFRTAGAVIAIGVMLPGDNLPTGWHRAISPSTPGFP